MTEYGGSLIGSYGGGTVYKLFPAASGWLETVLHIFGASGDGYWPLSGLTADQAGNLYGTTTVGSANNNGTVYELSPNADGTWTETMLYSFGSSYLSTGAFRRAKLHSMPGLRISVASHCYFLGAQKHRPFPSGSVTANSRSPHV